MSVVRELECMKTYQESAWWPWIVCVTASLFFFYEFIQGNMFASIADDIMRDFQIQADKMAWLSSVYYLSNVLFLFVAGIILDRYSAKKTLMIAMFLCVVSTFILASAQSFFLAMCCRFITGIGSAFCFLGPVRIATSWFPPRRMALVTGVIVTIAMTGGMLAQYPLTRLVLQVGWRDAVFQVGCLGVFLFVLMMIGVVDKKALKTHAASPERLWVLAKQVYGNIQTILAASYASLMNMAIAVFGAMMGTLYLVERLDVPKDVASSVNTMLFLGSIVGGPFIGWISDKIQLRILPMKAGLLASLFVVLMILYVPQSLVGMKVLFFLLGFFTAAQIISYALVAESNSPLLTAMSVSVVSVLVQSGYVLYQNLFTYLLGRHGEMQIVNGTPVYSLGDYQSAGMLLPLGLVIAFLCLSLLKETHARHQEL